MAQPLPQEAAGAPGAPLAPPPSTNTPARPAHALRLDQLVLVGTVLLVAAVVGSSGTLQSLATVKDFHGLAERQRAQIEKQTRDVGVLLAHLISTTSSSALRDNNYAFLSDLVGPIVKSDASVLRVRIVDRDGSLVADTAGKDASGLAVDKIPSRRWLTSAYRGVPVLEYREPIKYEGSAATGAVVLTYSLEPLHQALARLEQTKSASVRRTILRTVGLGVTFLLIGAVLAAFQARRVTKPLAALTHEAMRLADGDLQARVAPTGAAGMEVMALGVVFNHMADEINVLLQNVREKAALDQQVQVARTVQENLLPERAPLQIGPLRIAGVVQPADECGGDWWLHSRLRDGRVLIGTGDATGHGLPSALIATAACSAFATVANLDAADGIDATFLMNMLNRGLVGVGRGRYQMTCAVAILDLRSAEIEFCGGGHPFPFVFNRTTRKMSALMSKGPRLGERHDAAFTSAKTQLQPGDVIVWYSDGITEAENGRDGQYGTKRLRHAITRSGDEPAEGLRDALMAEVQDYTIGRAQDDDLTVVVVEFQPKVEAR